MARDIISNDDASIQFQIARAELVQDLATVIHVARTAPNAHNLMQVAGWLDALACRLRVHYPPPGGDDPIGKLLDRASARLLKFELPQGGR